jgi:ATP-binding cassette subfamily F protein uup
LALLLRTESLTKGYGDRTLFDGISIAFQDDQRVGLIGPNGAGKSTFMRILAGRLQPDAGRIEQVGNVRVGYVAQEDTFTEGATAESVLHRAVENLPVREHLKETRAGVMLGKLGFDDPAQPVDTMSGGWRKRLALGRELVREPDLLLMDEPTNHLDLEGIAWLEVFLERSNQAYVLVSHDRRFLDQATNRTVELNPRYADGFFSVAGPYREFVEKREALFHTQEKRRQALKSVVREEKEWLRRGPKARGTKANYRVDEAHRMMEDLQELGGRIDRSKSMDLTLRSTERRTNDLVVAQGLAGSMGGQELFRDLNLTLGPGTCLGIVGNNGTGKTTLLRVLAGELEPSRGTVRHAKRLRMSHLDQQRQTLDENVTLRRALAPGGDVLEYHGNRIHVQGWAERFLFRPEQLDQLVGALSGGEKARILLANLMRRPADVLLLDEPTNDLDIPSVEQLEDALKQFPGAVVLITHDRQLLDNVCTEVVGLHRDATSSLYANVEQWRVREEQIAREQAEQARRRKQKRREERDRAGTISYQELKELRRVESRIEKAEEKAERLHQEVQSGSYGDDHEKLNELLQAWHEAREHVDELYERWAELEEKRG